MTDLMMIDIHSANYFNEFSCVLSRVGDSSSTPLLVKVPEPTSF